jgi:hypothetical protein
MLGVEGVVLNYMQGISVTATLLVQNKGIDGTRPNIIVVQTDCELFIGILNLYYFRNREKERQNIIEERHRRFYQRLFEETQDCCALQSGF